MAARLPILTFHAIDKRSSVISISPTLFQGAMAKLYQGGYQALRLMQTVDFLRRGTPFPDRSFVITQVYGQPDQLVRARDILNPFNGADSDIDFLKVFKGDCGL